MKWIPIILAILLLLSACNRSVPTVSAPTTTTTAASTRSRTDTTATTTTSNTPRSTTTTERITTTTATATSSASSTTTTTTTAQQDELLLTIQEMTYITQAIGPFTDVNELEGEQIIKALYAYGVATGIWKPYTALEPPITTITVPIDTVDTLCNRFFGRTYPLQDLSFSMYDEAVQANCTDKALGFTILSGHGDDYRHICTKYKTSGQTVSATLIDIRPLPDNPAIDYVKIDGKYYEIRATYTLTLQENGEDLQLVSLKITE